MHEEAVHSELALPGYGSGSAKLVRPCGYYRGHCYADRAIQVSNGKDFLGRTLVLNEARPLAPCRFPPPFGAATVRERMRNYSSSAGRRQNPDRDRASLCLRSFRTREQHHWHARAQIG